MIDDSNALSRAAAPFLRNGNRDPCEWLDTGASMHDILKRFTLKRFAAFRAFAGGKCMLGFVKRKLRALLPRRRIALEKMGAVEH